MKLWHSAVIIAVLLAIDLVSKIWIRANVPLYELTTLIPNLIDLTHVQNRGVSFSFLSDLDDSIQFKPIAQLIKDHPSNCQDGYSNEQRKPNRIV